MNLLLLAAVTAALTAPATDTARFHQGIDYRIDARLDEATRVVTGRARLHYTNRAPAALDTLWFHLHLNALRPNSAWARRELEYGERRFQDLGPDDHAFERLRGVSIDSHVVTAVYPGAPDSTVVAFPLATPLAPGEAVTVTIDWDARPSALPRRHGRRDRHYDFAQWYPRIAVHDRDGWQVQPLLPQGEFYGEFGSYDVALDRAGDQVVGATGVPVSGDPGWDGAAVRGGAPAGARLPDQLVLGGGGQPGRGGPGRRDGEHARGRAYGVFHQWLHTTGSIDYRVGEANTTQGADAHWVTRVEVMGHGEIWMPVDIEIGTHRQRLDSRERVQTVTVTTSTRPERVALDPDEVLLEPNVVNNWRTF